MRLPIIALVVISAAHPARTAAQRAAPGPVADTLPASAVVVDEHDLVVKPELLNRSAIVRLLTRSYPEALREEGRTGRVTVTVVVDPAGVPRLVSVTGSSGIPEFDDASLRVTRAMRFSPPVLNGSPVWVRLLIPVEFSLVR
ncbi:MAG TPA: TonB family protein [Longimicrobium sp.]|jgi:TonB family protein|nr:TonB family protein [Longimicrobium sp.]